MSVDIDTATRCVARPELTRDRAAWQGARAMLPWLAGVAPLGLIVGAATAANGVPLSLSLVSGALIFSGPSQLAAIELLGAGAGVAAVVATVMVMNVHLLILGSSIAPHWRRTSLRFRAVAASMLIDPTFIEADRRYRSGEPGGHAFYLGAAVALALAWHLSIVVGATVGARVPAGARLEWVLPLFVLAELVQRLRSSAVVAAVGVGGGVACLAHSLPMNGAVLLAIVAAAAAGVTVERRPS